MNMDVTANWQMLVHRHLQTINETVHDTTEPHTRCGDSTIEWRWKFTVTIRLHPHFTYFAKCIIIIRFEVSRLKELLYPSEGYLSP